MHTAEHFCLHSCSIIVTAFFATVLVFGCFTLSALWAEQRTYLYLGGQCSLPALAFAIPTLIFMSTSSISVHLPCMDPRPNPVTPKCDQF